MRSDIPFDGADVLAPPARAPAAPVTSKRLGLLALVLGEGELACAVAQELTEHQVPVVMSAPEADMAAGIAAECDVERPTGPWPNVAAAVRASVVIDARCRHRGVRPDLIAEAPEGTLTVGMAPWFVPGENVHIAVWPFSSGHRHAQSSSLGLWEWRPDESQHEAASGPESLAIACRALALQMIDLVFGELADAPAQRYRNRQAYAAPGT